MISVNVQIMFKILLVRTLLIWVSLYTYRVLCVSHSGQQRFDKRFHSYRNCFLKSCPKSSILDLLLSQKKDWRYPFSPWPNSKLLLGASVLENEHKSSHLIIAVSDMMVSNEDFCRCIFPTLSKQIRFFVLEMTL